MQKIHAHEVLHMMEGNSYATKEALKGEIIAKFGENTVFHTCSAEGMDSEALIEFLEKKGKFKSANIGFTMDITKVCESY